MADTTSPTPGDAGHTNPINYAAPAAYRFEGEPNISTVYYRLAYELTPMLAALKFMSDAARVFIEMDQSTHIEASAPEDTPKLENLLRERVTRWREPLGDFSDDTPLTVITNFTRVVCATVEAIAADADAVSVVVARAGDAPRGAA